MRPALTLALLIAAMALAACANTRGSWSCGADRGVPCQSIADLDRSGQHRSAAAPAPVAQGASAVRWWSTSEAVAGAFDGSPRREPDQVVRVLVAGWTDAAGDFHAPSDIYAVMRRGGWWAPPSAAPLAPAKAAKAETPRPSATPEKPTGPEVAPTTAAQSKAGIAP